MNFNQLQSNVLAKSNLCFYILLDARSELCFANEYFLQSFTTISSFYNALTPSNAVTFANAVNIGIEGHSPVQNIEVMFMNAKGSLVNIKWEIAGIEYDGVQYAECMGIPVQSGKAAIQDIKQHEQIALPVSSIEEQGIAETPVVSQTDPYKLLFYKHPLPIMILEVATLKFIEINEAAIEHYGYTREEFLGMDLEKIRVKEKEERFAEYKNIAALREEANKGYWKHCKKNGQIIDVQITAHDIIYENKAAKLVLSDDITEQRRVEKELIISNERYNYASKASFDAIWDWDLKTNNLYWGDGFKILFGYDIKNNQGDISTWYKNIHPDEKERVTKGIFEATRSGATSWTDEYKYKKADGVYAYVIDRGIIIRDQNGEAYRMIGAMQDTTIRKINEQQLVKMNLQLLRQQRERELTASILRSLSEKEMLSDALEDILRKLTIFFQFEIGEAWLINMDRNRIELKQKWYASREMGEFYKIHQHVTFKTLENTQLGEAWKESEIIFIEDLGKYESFIRKEGAIKLGLKKSLGVPIIFNGQTIAVFSFFGKNEFTDKEKTKSYFESLSLQLGIDMQRKKAEEELNKFFELTPDILSIIGFDGLFKKVNAAITQILGFSTEEILKLNFRTLVHPDDLGATLENFVHLQQGNTVPYFENRFRTKDGDYKWLAWTSTPMVGESVIHATAKDVTENKQLYSSVNRILESISDGFFTVDAKGNILYWNQRAEKILHLMREEVLGKNIFQIFRGTTPKKFYTVYKEAFDKNLPIHFEEFIPGFNTWFEVNAYPYEGILSVFFRDVTDRKNSQEMVRVSNERYEVLAKSSNDIIWDWNIDTNNVIWNEGLKRVFNYLDVGEAENRDWWSEKIHPEDQGRVVYKLNKHIHEGSTNWEDEYRFRGADGSYKHILDRGFTIYNDAGRPIRMIGSMQNLAETRANEMILKELNQSLEKRAIQLAASNAELERFAYVASHDLQEPLRMVSSFLQLIERKYKDKLDQKAHEYIRFAVDGADRMKGLILDLLEYSRVNTRKEEKEDVDLNEVAANLLQIYENTIDEVNGKIIIDKLPVVRGSRLQLTRLFQNLVGNALKYRSAVAPEIRIKVEDKNDRFEFAVSDNGIGIEQRFFNKIFVIFQRLHNKTEYSGTGIGLAICKKIIELHSGNIWVESEPGEGSTFYFTLPKVSTAEQSKEQHM